MGNINNQSQQSSIPVNFKVFSQSQSPILGQIKHIINTHDQNEYALLQKIFVSENEFEKCLKKIKNRSKLGKMKKKYQPNEYIIEILDYRFFQHSQFCGRTFKLFIFIKNYDCDLSRIFKQRKSNNRYYDENEIIQLMFQIVNCLIELYDHNIKPYHLSLESILVMKNKLKIVDCDLTNQMSPLDSLNFKSQLRRGTYLAPQIIGQNGQYQSNTPKSDIFTLGMIILSLIYLKQQDEVYNYNQRTIDFQMVQQLIRKCPYSQNLKVLMREMLQEYPQQRIGILRLKQSLSKSLPLSFIKQKGNQLQDSSHQHSQTQKSIIYLGKQPNSKKYQFHQSSQFTTKPQKQRKNSYHKLMNQKTIQRQKKSVSFHADYPINNRSLIFENPQKSVSRVNVKQTPQTNIQVTPILQKYKQNVHHHDLSDIKSDTPVSPITLQTKQMNIPKFNQLPPHSPYLQYHAFNKFNKEILNMPLESKQDKKFDYKIPSFVQQNNLHKNKNIHFNIDLPPQSNQRKQNFDQWILKQKNKLNLKAKSNETVDNSNIKPIKIPTFQRLDIIQKLQTPRISKNIKESSSKLQKQQVSRKQIIQQTPIKSLELIQTAIKEDNKKLPKQIQVIQEEKIFGRYDFSNGSVYEGQFNSKNQFQGNGVLYFSSGKIFYSGCWKSNQFHGFGILNNIENEKVITKSDTQINYKDFNLNDNNLWVQYEGQFYEDKKHGFGTLYFANGDKFSGCFVNDSIQGFGNFYRSKDSQTVMGIWMNNIYRQN